MAISAKEVAKLRQMTGAGMMECKKFLQMTDGDIDKAITEMRKSGQAKADKKSGRIAADGAVVASLADDKKQAVMLEVNSETDFVARDDNFIQFVNETAKVALSSGSDDVTALKDLTLDGGQTVEEARQQLVAKIGENIQVRRMIRLSADGVIGCYMHGGRIGVLVAMKRGDESLAKDLAMHIAASKPIVVSSDQVPSDAIENEREIYTAQARESGKPEEIIAKMIEGRLNKFIDEVSLLGQPFVKDPNKKISQLLKEHNAEVEQFIRFEVGEGIEAKEDNFVEEVMAQVRDQ